MCAYKSSKIQSNISNWKRVRDLIDLSSCRSCDVGLSPSLSPLELKHYLFTYNAIFFSFIILFCTFYIIFFLFLYIIIWFVVVLTHQINWKKQRKQLIFIMIERSRSERQKKMIFSCLNSKISRRRIFFFAFTFFGIASQDSTDTNSN